MEVMSSLTSKMDTGVQSSVLNPTDMFEAISLLNENKVNMSRLQGLPVMKFSLLQQNLQKM